MKYFVEDYERRIYQEFSTYREAEIYCGENNIPGEYIYKIGKDF